MLNIEHFWVAPGLVTGGVVGQNACKCVFYRKRDANISAGLDSSADSRGVRVFIVDYVVDIESGKKPRVRP